MKRLSAVLSILLLVSFAYAQQTWWRTYGGRMSSVGYSVQQTTDGGYIVAGYTFSYATGYDFYLVKTDSLGDTLWTKTYGGTNGDEGFSIQQTTDGGYIVAGFTTSFGAGGYDVWLIKTNASGDTLWTRTYGGTGDDYGYSVKQTSDGGYIIAGLTWSFGAGSEDVYLIKTDASGDTLWTRTYGGLNYDYGSSVQQTADGSYIIAGRTRSFGAGHDDAYLIKTDTSGDILWTRTYGGTLTEAGNSVQQTSDEGYIIAGFTTTFGAGLSDVYLIKTKASGDTLWTRTYGGTVSDVGNSVQQTSDGGYIIAGTTYSFGAGNGDVWLIKTNSSGDTLWTRTFGGTNTEEGFAVQQTQDGGYIVAGYAMSFGPGNADVYLIKTDGNGNVGVEETGGSRQLPIVSLKPTPNPFTSFASVPGHSLDRFALYDISGRRVGIYRGDRIGEGLAAGVYFLRPEGRDAKPARVVKVR